MVFFGKSFFSHQGVPSGCHLGVHLADFLEEDRRDGAALIFGGREGVAPAFRPGHQHFAVGSGPQVYLASSPEGSDDSVQVVFVGHLDQLRVYQRFTLHAVLLNAVVPVQDLPASINKTSE